MAKIKFNNNDIRSISTVQIGSTDPFEFVHLLAAFTSIFGHPSLSEAVSEPLENDLFALPNGLPIGNIIFTFKPTNNPNVRTRYEKVLSKDKINNKANLSKKNPLNKFKYNGYTIPKTMDLSQ
jgi:hypothetical protein